jgi:hypothetical protein
MGHLKDFQQGTNGDPFNGPVNGTVGATTASTGAFTTLSATGVTTVQAGTEAAPAITTTGDTNTGIWFPAADTIAFTEGGVESMRINASGNLGLGVTPSAWDSTYKAIQVGARSMFFGIGSEANMANNAYYNSGYKYVAASAAGLYTIDTNVHKWYRSTSTPSIGASTAFDQAMTLDATGDLYLGTTSGKSIGNYKFITTNATTGSGYSTKVNGTEALNLYANSGASVIQEVRNLPIVFETNATERARIDSSGNVGIAQTDPTNNGVSGYNNLVIGNSTSTTAGITIRTTNTGTPAPGIVFARGTGGANAKVYYDQSTDRLYCQAGGSGGVYLAAGGTSWTSASDERVKDIIEPIENATQKLANWRTVIGKYKSDTDGVRRSFLIAQDVLTTFPEAVNTDKAEEYGLNYQDLIPLLVASIQELKAEFDAYKASHP